MLGYHTEERILGVTRRYVNEIVVCRHVVCTQSRVARLQRCRRSLL